MARKKKSNYKSKVIDAEFRVVSEVEHPIPEPQPNPFRPPGQRLRFQSPSFEEQVDAQQEMLQSLPDAGVEERATEDVPRCIGCKRDGTQVKLKEKFIGPLRVMHCRDCARIGKSVFNLLF